ncbi:MAG: leucine-rich repeat domain-containing protein [Alphaproteobacteria bacterium]|nr:leucine-rich repeat domain-containing protein [Alphaproteobacteria bacterium]
MFSGISFAMDNNGGDPSDSNNNGMLRKRERAADTTIIEAPASKKIQTENTLILDNMNANHSALSLLDANIREFITTFQSLRFDSDCDDSEKKSFIKKILKKDNPLLILQIVKKIIDIRITSIDLSDDENCWNDLIAALNTLDSKNYNDIIEISKLFDTTPNPWDSYSYVELIKIYNLLKNKFQNAKTTFKILTEIKKAIRLSPLPYSYKIIVKALLNTQKDISSEIEIINQFSNSPCYNIKLFDHFIEILKSKYRSDDFKTKGFQNIINPLYVNTINELVNISKERDIKSINDIIYTSQEVDVDSKNFFFFMNFLKQLHPLKFDKIINRTKELATDLLNQYEEITIKDKPYRPKGLPAEKYNLFLPYQRLINILNRIDPTYYNQFDIELLMYVYHLAQGKDWDSNALTNALTTLKKIKGGRKYLVSGYWYMSFNESKRDFKKIMDYTNLITDGKNFNASDYIKILKTSIKLINLGFISINELCLFKNIKNINDYLNSSNATDLCRLIKLLSIIRKEERSNVFTEKKLLLHLGNIDNIKKLKYVKYINLLTSLDCVNIISTYLTSFPETMGDLINLEELKFTDSQITFLPETIGSLTKLKELNLYKNKLTSLPEAFGNLTKLVKLDLSQNKLTSLPEIICNLTELEKLNLYNNKLTSLHEKIGNLTNLEDLKFPLNSLTSLPGAIGNLTKLIKLHLGWNNLTSLPETFGNLTKLKDLELCSNNLTSLPATIGSLINIQNLNLTMNALTTIPASITNLTNLTVLDLTGNPYLLPQSDNPLEWGKDELRARFGDLVIFDDASLKSMPNETNAIDVYSALDKKPLRINRNVFATNKLPEINVNKVFNGHEMLDVLEQIMADLNFYDEAKPGYLSYEMLASDFASDAKNQNLSNLDKVFQYLMPRLTGYIRALYKLPLIGNDVKPWKMYKSQIPETQKALTFIMDRINHTIDPDAKMLLFNLLVNGLLHCPTGQAEGINSVAYALSENGYQTNNFKDNLKRFLAVKKNAHFTTAILAKAANNSQNVHLISAYRDQLKDELGLNAAITSYQERMGTMGQDPFAENKWNVVQTFYGLVSPDRLIDWVMQASETIEDAQDFKDERAIGLKKLSPVDLEKEILRLRAKTRQNRQFRPFTAGSIAEYLYSEKLISDDENDTNWQKYFTANPLDTDGAPAILTRDGAKAILIHEGFLIDDSVKDEMIVDNTSNNFNNWNSIDD